MKSFLSVTLLLAVASVVVQAVPEPDPAPAPSAPLHVREQISSILDKDEVDLDYQDPLEGMLIRKKRQNIDVSGDRDCRGFNFPRNVSWWAARSVTADPGYTAKNWLQCLRKIATVVTYAATECCPKCYKTRNAVGIACKSYWNDTEDWETTRDAFMLVWLDRIKVQYY